MPQKIFGSRDTTGVKLSIIQTYLEMYQKALSGRFTTTYIDAFAGSGEVPLSMLKEGFWESDSLEETVSAVIEGSAIRALCVEPSFDNYIFIDKQEKCLEASKSKLGDYGNCAPKCFVKDDANSALSKICSLDKWKNSGSFGSKNRGVVFLDPFGSQVHWETLEKIAATKCLDMWYLFPAGVGVFRQIGKDGSVHPTHEASIDRIFGTPDWRNAFLRPSDQFNLFDVPEGSEKVVTPESAADFMIQRLKGIFKGGVLEEKVGLGKHAYPSFYLIFAWGNDSPKAKDLAKRLGKAAIKANAAGREHGRTF